MAFDISKFVGIPYKRYGRDFDGCDCYGLVRLYFMSKYGIEFPLYANVWEGRDQIMREAYKDLDFTIVTEPREDDIVLLGSGGVGIHLGVFIHPDRILHTQSVSYYSCIDKLMSTRLQSHIERYYRVDTSAYLQRPVHS